MTLPVTRKSSAVLSAVTTADELAQTRPPGWDPFEVWRTRILLPRLGETGKQEAATPAVKLVRR